MENKETQNGHYTIPASEKLSEMTSEQLSAIPCFTIGVKDIGSVEFLDTTDVRGVAIDQVVEFNHGEIVVYPDESIHSVYVYKMTERVKESQINNNVRPDEFYLEDLIEGRQAFGLTTDDLERVLS